ncbi:MAG: response regulator transcription factor [Ignavibacteriaceae bacterium]|nr:response regulator transcription factor [Ignavibacteriaceae bacterium]
MIKILLIEDDNSLRENVAEFLLTCGFKVYEAETGKKGLELYKKNDYDLILCDIMLPDYSGYEFLNVLKLYDEKVMPPFVFTTALADRASVRKGMEYGADDYLTKPFSEEELLKVVKTQVEKRKSLTGGKTESASAGKESEQEKKLQIEDSILVEIDNQSKFVKVNDILLISASGDYSIIQFTNGQKATVRKTLLKWEEMLPEVKFLRIHRTYIVNASKIRSIEKLPNYNYLAEVEGIGEKLVISQRFGRKLKDTIRMLKAK